MENMIIPSKRQCPYLSLKDYNEIENEHDLNSFCSCGYTGVHSRHNMLFYSTKYCIPSYSVYYSHYFPLCFCIILLKNLI